VSTIKTLLISLVLTCLFATASTQDSQAASFFPNGYTTYESFLSSMSYKAFSGDPANDNPTNGVHETYITPLGFNSDRTVTFKFEWNNVYSPNNTFTNQRLSQEYGRVMFKPGVMGGFYLGKYNWVPVIDYDSTQHQFVISPKYQILELTKAYHLDNGLTLSAGTAIVMMKADGIGENFDDYIVAISRTAPTPIPGAVWLLGSGLLGVIRFKRTRKAKNEPSRSVAS